MDLQAFLPYRLALLSERVSQCIALVYRERFGLSRDEWRVLAALADQGTVKTVRVIEATALEKMQVSRALSSLEEGGHVERIADPEDGRAWLVRLRPSGRALLQRIAPMVRAREQFLLDALTLEERAALDRAIERLGQQADLLSRQG